MPREFQNRSPERWLYLPAQGRENPGLAIFVHGFLGDYIGTWEQLPELLRDDADAQEVFRDWDYLFIGYRTTRPGGIERFKDIANLLVTHWRNAVEGGGAFHRRQQPYAKVALIAHSLGTLGVRHLVADDGLHIPQQLFPTLKAIAFFGTPTAGSYLAYLARVLAPISGALQPASPELVSLRDLVKAAHRRKPWPQVRIMRNPGDGVVGTAWEAMVDWPGDHDRVHATNLGHMDMCKPKSWQSEPIDFLRDILR